MIVLIIILPGLKSETGGPLNFLFCLNARWQDLKFATLNW